MLTNMAHDTLWRSEDNSVDLVLCIHLRSHGLQRSSQVSRHMLVPFPAEPLLAFHFTKVTVSV